MYSVGRLKPIDHTFDQSMLDRIDMHIIHMRGKILLVTDQVFPIAPLPNATFATSLTCFRAPLLVRDGLENYVLIKRQRLAKSASPGGSEITQCK